MRVQLGSAQEEMMDSRLNMTGWWVSAVLLLATVLDPATGHAQKRESRDVQLRNDCRLAAQVLTDGHPDPHREWAVWMMPQCDESGPPVLARMWQNVEPRPDSLGVMIGRSVGIRDQRLFTAAVQIVEDPSQPEMKRAAALSLLARWASPGLSIGFRQFFARDFTSVHESGVTLGAISHDTQNPGAQPLPVDVLEQVAALARSVSASAEGFRLRAAADVIADSLEPPPGR
jgi:hypothetical protein